MGSQISSCYRVLLHLLPTRTHTKKESREKCRGKERVSEEQKGKRLRAGQAGGLFIVAGCFYCMLVVVLGEEEHYT